jgi:hypothetical protein
MRRLAEIASGRKQRHFGVFFFTLPSLPSRTFGLAPQTDPSAMPGFMQSTDMSSEDASTNAMKKKFALSQLASTLSALLLNLDLLWVRCHSNIFFHQNERASLRHGIQ